MAEVPEHLAARTARALAREEPRLGLASNEELLRELIVRFKMTQHQAQNSGSRPSVAAAIDRALVLAEMLGGMGAPEREYRTVGDG